ASAARSITPLAADLLDFGRGVFVADCRAPRGHWRSDDCGRRFVIEVPVRTPGSWSAEARRLVAKALDFLTGDRWEVRVVPHLGALPSRDLYLPFESRP